MSAVPALVALLDQLREVITLVPASVYVGRPAAAVSGSVGEHVRHCLDHVSALAAAMGGGELSYDQRTRGTLLEVDPVLAAYEIDRLRSKSEAWSGAHLDEPLHLCALMDHDGPTVLMRTTLARELGFVVQHTIHHCALIAVLLAWQGWQVPADFGVAPATARVRMRA